MYCIHCGQEIADGSRFCPYCGQQQKVSGPEQVNYGSKIEQEINNVGNSIGNGIDEAIDDFRSEFRGSGGSAAPIVYGSDNQGNDPEKKNWKDFFTAGNMELLAALALLLPLFMGVVNYLLTYICRAFYGIPGVGYVFRVIPGFVSFIFVFAACAGLGCSIYLIVINPAKRNLWGILHTVLTALSFVACLGIMLKWKPLPLILGIICVIYGIDAVSRVMLQGLGIESVPNVGNDLKAYKYWIDKAKQTREANQQAREQEMRYNPATSYFDGSGATLLGLSLLTMLVGLVTCGIGTPWMLCKIYKWTNTHTVIDGRRLDFNGDGGSLLGYWILWEFLSIITCGIYSFFVYVAIRKWFLQRTFYADQPGVYGQFDGNSFQFFGYGLLSGLLLTITCFLAGPWVITMIVKWDTKHCVVASNRWKYEGTALGILGQFLIVFLLSFITLGIYAPWGSVRLTKYIVSKTHVDYTPII